MVKKTRKKLYCVFVDFTKAYDLVDRKKLLQKLRGMGINGIFYRNIEAMYENTEYSIKLSKGSLKPIKSNLGLRQGCPLSPLLFNIYIDDIKYIFDETCNPTEIRETKINHFLYADDLVLLSLTKEGLQNCLDRLQNYCTKNSLIINIDKTKTMIFNYSGKLIQQPFVIGHKN